MNEGKEKREKRRIGVAQVLFTSLQLKSSDAVEKLHLLANRLKAEFPNQAKRIDSLVDPAIERTMEVPKVATTFFLVETQEPPEIIETESVNPTPLPLPPPRDETTKAK